MQCQASAHAWAMIVFGISEERGARTGRQKKDGRVRYGKPARQGGRGLAMSVCAIQTHGIRARCVGLRAWPPFLKRGRGQVRKTRPPLSPRFSFRFVHPHPSPFSEQTEKHAVATSAAEPLGSSDQDHYDAMADEGQAGPSGQGSGGGGGNGSGVLPIGTGMGSHPPSLEEPLPSSAQLQAAIDQITHLQRVLVGDDHMSLDELLAATAASGPSQGIPAGGMTRALPALLGPLLPLGGGTAQGGGHLSHEQTNVLFARRTAFQPRQYMAMAAELVQRTQAGEGSASSALALSDKIFAAAQQGGGHGTGNKLAEETLSLRERVLQNRKRKRIAQGNMSAPQSLMQSAKDQQELISASSKSARARSGVHRDQPSSRMTTTPAPFLFPGEQNAKIDGLGQGVRTLGRPSQDDLDVYLSAWYAKLQEVDVEASLAVAASVDSFASGQQACQATIRVEVACMGTAWVTVGFRSRDSARGEGQQSNEWGLRVESFNVRSETEVVSDEVSGVCKGRALCCCNTRCNAH